MKCLALIALVTLACALTTATPLQTDLTAAESQPLGATVQLQQQQQQSEQEQEQLVGAASSFDPLEDKKQEKRYAGYNGVGYGYGVDNYYNPYSTRLGLGGYGGYGGYSGYGGYGGIGGYGGYGGYSGTGLGYGGNAYGLNAYGGYAGNPYYYYSRFGGGYPNRVGYNGYPSSYYSSNYGSSIVGGGLGGLGAIPPVPVGVGGYNYGPGVSGTVY